MKLVLFCLLPITMLACNSSSEIGEISFVQRNTADADYTKSSSVDFSADANFGLSIKLKRSLKEYLTDLASAGHWETLCSSGNYQFTFFVGGKEVYQENLNPRAGTCDQKDRLEFIVPLASTRNEDSWGRYLWMRCLFRGGGDKALNARGEYDITVEIRPYIQTDQIIVGDLIASGSATLNTIKPIATKEQMKIQKIRENSGWVISKDNFDHDKIEQLKKDIIERRFRDITSVVIAKDGKLLLEEYFNDADRATLHNPRSVGKTFASTAMGLAIRDGHIKGVNTTLGDYYNLKDYDNYDPRKSEVTLKSLLSMSSGFDADDNDYDSPGNENNMYPTDNWVKFALDLKVDEVTIEKPTWKYFTAGVVVLGEILHRNVPGGLEKYLHEEFFKHMDITNYQWQYTTTDVPNTAGGLQLRAVDFAKFGQVYKNKGKWNGKQLIPEVWVEESFTSQITRSDNEDEQYGYLFWKDQLEVNGKSYGVTYCTGNGGNKIYIFDDLPFVIVITAQAYNMPYGHPQVKQMMEEYILPAVL